MIALIFSCHCLCGDFCLVLSSCLVVRLFVSSFVHGLMYCNKIPSQVITCVMAEFLEHLDSWVEIEIEPNPEGISTVATNGL